ncbi:MAG: glycosyltransferase family 1 protein [bacterium]|nr:glycosyltransferase family 1 protein [bacterium]
MRLGIDIRHLAEKYPAGVSHYTIETIRHILPLLQNDDKLVLFSSGRISLKPRIPQFRHKNVEHVHLAKPNKLIKFEQILRYRTLESYLPTNIDAWWFPNNAIFHTRLRFALTVHDLSTRFFPIFYERKELLSTRLGAFDKRMKDAAELLAVSERTAKDVTLHTGIPASTITLTPLGVAPRFSPREEASDRSRLRKYGIKSSYYLLLSTRQPRKNIESAVEAVLALQSQGDDTPLVIAGAKGWKTAPQQCRPHIIETGYLQEDDLPALYRHAKVLLFPSFYEGFGLPALEAMASGTPVIASFTGAFPELIQENGVLVDPFNVRDIQIALHILSEDTELAGSLAKKGIERAKSFTWQATAEKTLDTLRRMVK